MLQRIKRAYREFKRPEGQPTGALNVVSTPEWLELHKPFYRKGNEPIGDGNAEFLGEGSEQEYKEQQDEDKGFKGIFGL